MAENCYCSVTFKTGEELDEALLKAKTACDEAEKAILAKEAIENMEVCTCEVPPGSEPTVEKGVSETGCVKLTFGIPTPKDANVTAENIEAALGYKPANADDMVAGVHVGTEPPDDPNATFYIDTDDEPDSPGGGGASAQADWNAAEGEPGHILNRTHWSEWVEVVPEQTVAYIEDEGCYALESDLVFVEGETYRVKFDGVVYDCEAWLYTEEGYTFVMLGNAAFMGIGDDTGEPFVVGAFGGMLQILLLEPKPEINLSISAVQYHKIPVQYLHDGVHWIDAVEVDGALTQITVTTAQTAEAIKAGMDVKLRIYKTGSQDIGYVDVLPCVTYQTYTTIPYTLVFNGKVGLIPTDKTIRLAWDFSSGSEDVGQIMSLPWVVSDGD